MIPTSEGGGSSHDQTRLAELILDRAPSAVVSMDEAGVVTYWNPSAERIFGRPRAEAVGCRMAELIVPERLRAAHLEGVRRFLARGADAQVADRRLELAALRADGTEFPIEITFYALRVDAGWTFHAFVRDLSHLRRSQAEQARLVRELQAALHGAERRFDAIVGSLSDPVTIRDPEHRFVYANEAAIAHLGFHSWEEMRQSSPDEVMADYDVSDQDGRPITMQEIPSVRILRGEPPAPLLIRTVHRRTGERRWQLLKSAPLLGPDGAVDGTIMVIEDVTDVKRAEVAATFLASASAVLASSLDHEQTLRNVAQLAVPTVVDWCAVDLIDEHGERQSVAVAHSDPERLALAEQLRAYEPEQLDRREGIGRVFTTGRPLLYPEITEEMLRQAAVDERQLELLRAVGFRAAMIVPMSLGGRTLGAMTLVTAESGRVLDEHDLELAEQVAARAAVAIENSRLYSERSTIADTLQRSLLPEGLPDIPGYGLAAMYAPAVARTEVGGDFYDAWPVGEDWMLAIGDVAGKGVKAAAQTALVRHTLRAASEYERSPAALLAQADRALKGQLGQSICTALCVRLERERLTLAVGGHPLPLLLSADGVQPVGDPGPLLGGLSKVGWDEHVVELEPGTTLVTYTDGVTDALGADGSRFGVDRLQATLRACRERRAAHEVVSELGRALELFQPGGYADDTAVLVLHRLAPAVAAAAATLAQAGS
ncbi:MAG: SpoIIE family protein phosphatase [Solirubrobacteraceae bacterium]